MLDVATKWTTGRAGMLYRDLTPAGFKDQIIVSHIRLPFEGEVPDYVHYHKIEFQLVYCLKGRIRVVYEDQGEPFWLETGDCVFHPPEIRHRVLACTSGAEVIEVTTPARHETFANQEMLLPTGRSDADRIFNGQRFVRHIAADTGHEVVRNLGISAATGGRYSACVEPDDPPTSVDCTVANGNEIRVNLGQGKRLTVVL